MPTVRPGLRALALLLAAGLTGCSFLAVNRQPMAMADPTRPGTPCEPSRVAPVVDSLLGGLYLAGTAKLVSDGKAAGKQVIPAVALAGVLATSAVYGFTQAGRCEDLVALHQRCLKGDQAACRTIAPAPEPARGPLPAPAFPRRCAGDAGCGPGEVCRDSACAPAAPPLPAPPAAPARAAE